MEPTVARPSLAPGEIAIAAGGLAVLIASFLPWYADDEADISWSGWSNVLSLMPLVPLMVLAAVGAAVVATTGVTKLKLPDPMLGFGRSQLLLALTFPVLLVVLAAAVRGGGDAADGKGAGVILALVGAIAAYVGAVLVARSGVTGGHA